MNIEPLTGIRAPAQLQIDDIMPVNHLQIQIDGARPAESQESGVRQFYRGVGVRGCEATAYIESSNGSRSALSEQNQSQVNSHNDACSMIIPTCRKNQIDGARPAESQESGLRRFYRWVRGCGATDSVEFSNGSGSALSEQKQRQITSCNDACYISLGPASRDEKGSTMNYK